MALLKCHECGKEVSTEAKACPSCGAKVKKPMSRSAKLLIAFLGISIAGGMVMTNRQQEQKAQAQAAKSPEQIAAEKKRDAQLQIATLGAMSIKKAMKDPASFDLSSLYVTKNGHACYEYRGKNSFGAVVPGSALQTPEGKMLAGEGSDQKFLNTWNKECTQKGGTEIGPFVKARILN